MISPDISANSDDFTKINIELGQAPQGIFTQHSFLGRITEKQTETNIHTELEERELELYDEAILAMNEM